MLRARQWKAPLILPLAIMACGCRHSVELNAGRHTGGEEYAVYSEILQVQRAGWKWGRCAVSGATTLSGLQASGVRPKRDEARYREEVADFLRKSAAPISLENRLDADLNCELIPDSEARSVIDALHRPPQPSDEMAPPARPAFDQVYEFSAVGFNAALDRAVVYVGHDCRGLCGDGRFVALQKVNGRWKVNPAYEPSGEGWVS